MALFSKKTKETKETTAALAAAAPKETSNASISHVDRTSVIKHARITEKASMQQAAGVYVFDVATSATKREIIQAVRALYKVTPRAIRMVNVPTKTIRSMRTGRSGMKGGGKKAYVYLKRGETINL